MAISKHSSFQTTDWARVQYAGRDPLNPAAGAALESLFRDYWYPVYAAVQRAIVGRKGFLPDEARDLTQSYFQFVLEKRVLASADPTRGRFRTFVITTIQNFINDEADRRDAKRRGGHIQLIPIGSDAEERYRNEPADNRTPAQLFEHKLAQEILQRAIAQLEHLLSAEPARAKLFRQLKDRVLLGKESDDSYQQLAELTGVPPAELDSHVHAFRKRLRELLYKNVLRTVTSESEVVEEMVRLEEAL